MELQKDFAELFGPLMPSVRKLKRFGHIGSGVSQAIIIYLAVASNLSNMNKGLVVFISLFTAFLVSSFIEGGISKGGAIWTRQLVRLKFSNRWFVLMWLIVTAFFLPLAILSPILSGSGAEYSVEALTPESGRTNTLHIETLFKNQQDSLLGEFDNQQKAIERQVADKIASITSKHEKRINIQDAIYNKNKKLYADGFDWAAGHMDKASNEVRIIKAERDREIDEIKSELLKTTTLLQGEKIAAIRDITKNKNTELDLIHSDDSEKKTKRSKFVFQWGSLGFYVFFGFSCLVYISIFITETYFAGGGKDYAKSIYEAPESRIDALFNTIDQQVDSLFDSFIKGIRNGFKVSGSGSLVKSTMLPGVSIKPKDDPEPFETKDFQVFETETETESNSETEIETIDLTKDIIAIRNYHRRANESSKRRTKKINSDKFNRLKEKLQFHGYSIKETSDRSLEITPP